MLDAAQTLPEPPIDWVADELRLPCCIISRLASVVKAAVCKEAFFHASPTRWPASRSLFGLRPEAFVRRSSMGNAPFRVYVCV
jgi:hypothetical protein